MKIKLILIALFILLCGAGYKHHFSIRQILKGSRASQRRQNIEADREGLTRIKNDAELKKMIQSGALVKIDSRVNVDPRVKLLYRYVRPWTNRYIVGLTLKSKKKFHTNCVKVTSAVRPLDYQKRLAKRNHNAAKTHGPYASSHPTGATVDITKRGRSKKQLKWLREILATSEVNDHIEVTEEHRQPVFHIDVFNH